MTVPSPRVLPELSKVWFTLKRESQRLSLLFFALQTIFKDAKSPTKWGFFGAGGGGPLGATSVKDE